MDSSNLNYLDEELDCTQEQYDAWINQGERSVTTTIGVRSVTR